MALVLPVQAVEWELKQDIRYRDSYQTREISYKDSGKFDKEKVKRGNRWRLESLLTATNETTVEDLEWVWRLGYKFERKDDRSIQLKSDGSLKKDKSRVEYERTKFMGLGIKYKQRDILGADRWLLKAHVDSFFDIEYSAGHLASDASSYHSNSSGWEVKARVNGEYSLGPMGWYVIPTIAYRQRYYSSWQDSVNDKSQASAREQRIELGLWLNWVMPVDGLEVLFGPQWQNNNEAERQSDQSWQWNDAERLYAYIKFEYEAPTRGFEMEFKIQHALRGDNIYDTKYNVELSYEF